MKRSSVFVNRVLSSKDAFGGITYSLGKGIKRVRDRFEFSINLIVYIYNSMTRDIKFSASVFVCFSVCCPS